MDEVKVINKKPLENSINPALLFTIEYSIKNNYRAPIEITGFLLSNDGKKISNISGFRYESDRKTQGIQAANGANSNTIFHKIEIIAPLNPKALDYIQEQRELNQNGNVILKLNINIRAINSQTCLSYMYLENPINGNPQPVMYKHNNQFSSQNSNMWILSGNSGPIFLEVIDEVYDLPITIPSSDWIHDFCPAFNIGKFFVFEYLMPDYVPGSDSLDERLNKAIDVIKDMELKMISGEWTDVIEDSRPISELLKNQDEIKALFNEDGFTDEAYNNLNASLKSIFDFSSKFHHSESKTKEVMPRIKASKEDAYLIYTISIATVNLISKKLQKKNKQLTEI
jgi:hypothetical protein